jgi:hypothetical protein
MMRSICGGCLRGEYTADSPEFRPVLAQPLGRLIGAVFLQILAARRDMGRADRKGMLPGDRSDFFTDFVPLRPPGGYSADKSMRITSVSLRTKQLFIA